MFESLSERKDLILVSTHHIIDIGLADTDTLVGKAPIESGCRLRQPQVGINAFMRIILYNMICIT